MKIQMQPHELFSTVGHITSGQSTRLQMIGLQEPAWYAYVVDPPTAVSSTRLAIAPFAPKFDVGGRSLFLESRSLTLSKFKCGSTESDGGNLTDLPGTRVLRAFWEKLGLVRSGTRLALRAC